MRRESGSCVLFSIPITDHVDFIFAAHSGVGPACETSCAGFGKRVRQFLLLQQTAGDERAGQPAAAPPLNQD